MNHQQLLAQISHSINPFLSQLVQFNDEQQEEQEEQEVDEENGENEYDEQNGENGGNEQYGENEIMEEEEALEQNEVDGSAEEQAYEGEDDVGLYGQQLDGDELESYENEQFSQDMQADMQADMQVNRQMDEMNPKEDDAAEQQFGHFRQVDREITKAVQKNDPLSKSIARLQQQNIDKKDWMLKGEVKGNQRPLNSLLEHDLQFTSGIKFTHEITPERNQQLENIIKKRIIDELYDDRTRFIGHQAIREHFGSLKEVSREKSKLGLAEIYQAQFKNYLQLGENKHDHLKKQILLAFRQVNYHLDSLSNFHFTPQNNLSKGEVVEVKEGGTVEKGAVGRMESEKEVDGKAKRLKNKRIARQKLKQRANDKLNTKIQYGGMTKFEAAARKKIASNTETKVDYSKSTKFFESMNQKGSAKPNPNIGKARM